MHAGFSLWLMLALALCVRLQDIWRTCISRLRSIPGPFLARFTRLWFLYKSYHGSFHLENIEMHMNYGPIVLWKHPDPKIFTLFADRDSKRHAETRRKFQNMYSLSSLKSYEPYVDECAEIFKQRFHETVSRARPGSGGAELDIGHWRNVMLSMSLVTSHTRNVSEFSMRAKTRMAS
ncbi:unnamed protein product [Clonostachys rosea f. rosea IK726]|uniref:Uncharacterized protein n=2 Tax=Bionectria ochroleuca TaxID=29856 RepID=A0A0B7K561_BIOOC|nr:unnamed protein product [Clonostachys rosea f. rosea IK726]